MIGFVIAGLIIGLLAGLIRPDRHTLSIFGTLPLGLAGSMMGGLAANLLGTGSIWELNVIALVVAVIAAAALIAGAERLTAARRDQPSWGERHSARPRLRP